VIREKDNAISSGEHSMHCALSSMRLTGDLMIIYVLCETVFEHCPRFAKFFFAPNDL
jgi:hypothetical protein